MKKSTLKALIVASGICLLSLIVGIAGTFALFQKQFQNTIIISVGDIAFDFDYEGSEGAAHAGEMYIEDAEPGAGYKGTYTLRNTGSTPFTASVKIPSYTVKQKSGSPATEEQLIAIKESLGIIFTDYSKHDYSLVNVDADNLTFDFSFNKNNEQTFVIASGDEVTFDMQVILDVNLGNVGQGLVIEFPVVLTCVQYVPQA